MKLYTKSGDNGTTALVGGTRVSKCDPRVEAYGTVDELISHLGLLRYHLPNKAQQDELLHIQQRLMLLSALLASDGSVKELPKIQAADIQALENSIDRMEEGLPALCAFVLPGPPTAAAQCHVARCVCRRAERCAIVASQQFAIDECVTQYLNRLSDYLFILSRQITHEAGGTEIVWLPK